MPARLGKGGKGRPQKSTTTPPDPVPPPIEPGPGTGTSVPFVVTAVGWLKRAHAFAQGQVPAGQGVVFAGVPTQNTILRTWPDGSAKHIKIKAYFSSTGTYLLALGTPATGTFTPTAPTITVEATPEGGAVKIATFSDTGYTHPWENGPLAKDTKQTLTFAGATGALSKVLVHVYLTSFRDGTHTVDFVYDNSQLDAAAGAVVATLVPKINGVAVATHTATVTAGSGTVTGSGFACFFSAAHGVTENQYIRATDGSGNQWFMKCWNASEYPADRFMATSQLNAAPNATWEKITFCLPWGSRGIERFAVSGHGAARCTQSLETFYQAQAMYRPHAALINHGYSQTMRIETPNVGGKTFAAADFGLLNYGIYAPQISLGGQRAELTVAPEWVMEWELYQTDALYDWMITHADLAAATGFHRTKATGACQTLADDPSFYYSNALPGQIPYGIIYSPELNGANGCAHQGGYFFIPYLVTGDRIYADEMAQHAMFGVVNHAAYLGARGGDKGWLFGLGNGPRSGAWTATKIAECLAFLPSEYAGILAEFTAIVANNNAREAYHLSIEPDTTVRSSVIAHEQLLVGNTTTIVNPPERGFLSDPNHGMQVYQQAYFVWASDYARRLGVTIFAGYRARLGASFVNILATTTQPRYWLNGFLFFGMPHMTTTLQLFADAQAMVDWNVAHNSQFWSVPTVDIAYAQYLRVILAVAARDGVAGASTWLTWLEGLSDGGHDYTYNWIQPGPWGLGLSNAALALGADEGYR